MQDGFSILSPAGYIMDVRVTAPVNGVGTYGGVTVSRPLPGGAVQVRGKGEFSLQEMGALLSGRQGTILINCTTGATGAAQALAFIAASPTLLLGVALDAINRPYAVVINELGVLVGQSSILGAAIPAGTPLDIEFAWDCVNVIRDGENAAFQFNDQVVVWVPNITAWTPFVPTALYIGTSLGGLGLSSFTGTIGKVQISNAVSFVTIPGAIIEAEESFDVVSSMAGGSAIGADAVVDYDGVSTMAGDSTVGASATVAYEAADAMAGDSAMGVGATVDYEAADAMAGDSTVGATAIVTP